MSLPRGAVLVLAACSFLACSGDDGEDPVGFEACGGEVVAGWDFSTVAFPDGMVDACTDTTVSGFVFFNDNGRYSLNADIRAWKSATGTDCGFNSAYGGFYRVEGTKICLGDSSASGDMIPCDGSRPTTIHAVLDYCVQGDTLTVRSTEWLDAKTPTVLTFTRRP